MSCVRCGNCCFYFILTLSPKYQDADIDLQDIKNLPEDAVICIDGQETFCPYLSWDDENNVAVCSVHDKPWYKQTGCHRHNNPEYGEDIPCRIGPYLRLEKNKKYMDILISKIKQHQKKEMCDG